MIKTSLGAGVTNLIHFNLNRRFPQFQYGISIGTFPHSKYSLLSLSSNITYYYGKFSRHTKLRQYFVRLGGGYFKIDNNLYLEKDLFAKLSFGMEIDFSEHVGIELAYGVTRRLYSDYIDKDVKHHPVIVFSFPKWIVLDINLDVFYRF